MAAITEQTTHTPGPYTIIRSHRKVPHVCCAGPNGGLIARCDTNKPHAENDANARLLAAAPDMLAALRGMADDFGYQCDVDACECGENGNGLDDDGKPCVHILVQRAIAKAEGTT